MSNKKFIIGGIALLVLMLGTTYAYYRWTSSEKININVGIEGGSVTFIGGSNVTGILIPVSSKTKGIKKDITVSAFSAGATMNLYMELTTMPNDLKDESFKYELYYNDSELIKSGNFAQYSSANTNGISYESSGVTTLTFFTNRGINTANTDKYTLYLWIDGENGTNPSSMQNKTLSFDLYATGENASLSQ